MFINKINFKILKNLTLYIFNIKNLNFIINYKKKYFSIFHNFFSHFIKKIIKLKLYLNNLFS